MTTLSNHLFDSVILDPADLYSRPVAAATAAARRRPARAATRMSASLWRHTLDENAHGRRHALVVRRVFYLIGTLGMGSVAYALWQTCNLMAGDTFQAAVQAVAK